MRARIVLLAMLAVAASRGQCGQKPLSDACAAKACGDRCTQCPSDDSACVETAVVKACDPFGRCVPETADLCAAAAAPCAGKACGDECVIDPPCRDAVPPCMAPSVLGHCDATGACIPVPSPMPLCPPHPDCVGKACGDPCNPCGPDRTCPTLIPSVCDPSGRCVGDVPGVCPG